jgi:hypothetical protein
LKPKEISAADARGAARIESKINQINPRSTATKKAFSKIFKSIRQNRTGYGKKRPAMKKNASAMKKNARQWKKYVRQ